MVSLSLIRLPWRAEVHVPSPSLQASSGAAVTNTTQLKRCYVSFQTQVSKECPLPLLLSWGTQGRHGRNLTPLLERRRREASSRGECERPGSVHLPPSCRGTKEQATRGPSHHSLPGIQPGSVKTYVVKLPGLLNLKLEQINGLFSSTKFGSNLCTAIATRKQICSGSVGLP